MVVWRHSTPLTSVAKRIFSYGPMKTLLGVRSTLPSVSVMRHFSTESTEKPLTPEEEKVIEAQVEKDLGDIQLGDLNEVNEPTIKETEVVKGESEQHTFQAETKKLLSIVARSLYKDKEVFIRELISNASDALEKAKYAQSHQGPLVDEQLPLEINISVDPTNKIFSIQDYGIGMAKSELIKNLGTIAHSGTASFIAQLEKKSHDSLIGQFGVGFYSSFIVSDTVKVYSRSATDKEAPGHLWNTDGEGSYTINEAEGVSRGTKIMLKLKDESAEFSSPFYVESIIKKYSNFVGYPIKLNGRVVNTVQPLWLQDKKDITEQQHNEFFRFISHMNDDPFYHFHFVTDSPLSLRSLFYVPKDRPDRFFQNVTNASVSIYTRKVLVEHNSKKILPEWLRFVHGVVDCEDIPLNVSRETLQDSNLIHRLSTILTRRIIRFFEEEATKDPEKYLRFYKEFSIFLNEGLCRDQSNKAAIAKLVRLQSSQEKGKYFSLDEYVARMKSDQEHIYFLPAPSYDSAMESAYIENYKNKGIEVLILSTIDEEVGIEQLAKFDGKRLLSVSSSEALLKNDKSTSDIALSAGFESWIKSVLPSDIPSVQLRSLSVNTPMLVVDQESSMIRQYRLRVDPNSKDQYALQINTGSPIIRQLDAFREKDNDAASALAEQIFVGACLTAGVETNAKRFNESLSKILARTMTETKTNN